MRTIALLTLLILLGGCCCRSTPCCVTATAKEPMAERRFVVVRATPLAEDSAEGTQVLIETSEIVVRRATAIEALEKAERLATTEAPVWLAGSQLPDATFGAKSTVVASPSVVSNSGEEATIEILREEEPKDHLRLTIAPVVSADGAVSMRLTYRRDLGSRGLFEIPTLDLDGPAKRVFIVEAKRLR